MYYQMYKGSQTTLRSMYKAKFLKRVYVWNLFYIWAVIFYLFFLTNVTAAKWLSIFLFVSSSI